jgi:protoheme IX farnesyltransferase
VKMSSQQALAALDVPKDGPGLLSDFMALTKARLSMLVLITTFVGFCMATAGPIDWFLLFNTLLGTALVAASAAVFNQAVEMNVDRLMERTRNRPLPGGRMKQETAGWRWGVWRG